MKYVLILLSLFICSCSDDKKSWLDMEYHTTLDNLPVSIQFQKNGHFSGQIIGYYFGTYRIDKENISLTLEQFETKNDVPYHLKIKKEYLKSLQKIHTYSIENHQLILRGEKNIYTFSPLNTD